MLMIGKMPGSLSYPQPSNKKKNKNKKKGYIIKQ